MKISGTTYSVALACKIFEDRLVGKDDLRLKLMRKGSFQRSNGGAEQNTMDLREKLSRNHKKLPRYDSRGHAAESRASYDMRDEPPELRSRYFSREDVLGSRNSSVVSRVPYSRTADDLLKSNPSRKSYPSWTDDGLRHRSPERILSVRSDVSPPVGYDQIRSMPPLRSAGSSRPQSFITRGAPDTPRSQPYAGKATISVDTVQRTNGITPSSAPLPKVPVMVCICTSSHIPNSSMLLRKHRAFWSKIPFLLCTTFSNSF